MIKKNNLENELKKVTDELSKIIELEASEAKDLATMKENLANSDKDIKYKVDSLNKISNQLKKLESTK